MRKSTRMSNITKTPNFIYVYNFPRLGEVTHVNTEERMDKYWKTSESTGIWNVKYKDPVTLK